MEKFDILPAKGEENAPAGVTPDCLVQTLATQKAREIAALPVARTKAVLGSDTVVALDKEVLGKPKDAPDAARMLSALSGRAHQVYTGVCISVPDGKGGRKEFVRAACTNVYFYSLTPAQIQAYIATGSPMDKAGAYGIQDGGLVEKIEGSFTNVVGLPVELCEEMIEEMNAYLYGG